MVRRLVMRKAYRSQRLSPHSACIVRMVGLDQELKKRERTGQLDGLAERQQPLPNNDRRRGLSISRHEINRLEIGVLIGGQYLIQKNVWVLTQMPEARNGKWHKLWIRSQGVIDLRKALGIVILTQEKIAVSPRDQS